MPVNFKVLTRVGGFQSCAHANIVPFQHKSIALSFLYFNIFHSKKPKREKEREEKEKAKCENENFIFRSLTSLLTVIFFFVLLEHLLKHLNPAKEEKKGERERKREQQTFIDK